MKRQVLHNVLVSGGVVVDAITGAHHRVLECLPGDSDARREIVAVRIHQRDRVYGSGEGPRLPRQNRSNRSETRCNIQVDDAIVDLAVRRDILVAQSDVQGQIAADPPFILRVEVPGIAAKVISVDLSPYCTEVCCGRPSRKSAKS